MIRSTNYHNGPIVFAKWDIKDGFWRLVIFEDDAWHFAYVLPSLRDTNPIKIMVPTCLQMGWCESPLLFCTASKTAWDVAQDLWDLETNLEPHPLETYSIPNELNLPELTNITCKCMANLLEVYMDDFFGMMQAPTIKELHKFTRAILIGIHSIFPPPGLSNDPTDEPISIKKLKSGDGLWSTQKEILGWLFDGIMLHATTKWQSDQNTCTPHPDIQTKTSLPRQTRKMEWTSYACNNQHPKWRGFLLLLVATIATKGKSKFYKNKLIQLNSETKQALQDWTELLCTANLHPTPCADLLPAPATYSSYCDALKSRAGGIWFGIEKSPPPIVWHTTFPSYIQDEVVSLRYNLQFGPGNAGPPSLLDGPWAFC